MAEDIGKLFLRLGVGGLMLFHGVHKLLTGLDSLKMLLSAHGIPQEFAYVAYLGEIIGPILVILGVFTRIGAFLMVAEVAALIVLGGTAQLLSLTDQGAYSLEVEMLYAFGALALVFGGGGKIVLSKSALS